MGGRTRAQTCTRPDALSIATAERKSTGQVDGLKELQNALNLVLLVSLQPGLRSSLKTILHSLANISKSKVSLLYVKMASAAESLV